MEETNKRALRSEAEKTEFNKNSHSRRSTILRRHLQSFRSLRRLSQSDGDGGQSQKTTATTALDSPGEKSVCAGREVKSQSKVWTCHAVGGQFVFVLNEAPSGVFESALPKNNLVTRAFQPGSRQGERRSQKLRPGVNRTTHTHHTHTTHTHTAPTVPQSVTGGASSGAGRGGGQR